MLETGLEDILAHFPPDAAVTPPAPAAQASASASPILATRILFEEEYVRQLLEGVREGNWHNNLLRVVAHYVGSGYPDWEIQRLCAGATLPEYTTQQTAHDVQKMIDGARAKGWGSNDQPDDLVGPVNSAITWAYEIETTAEAADFIEGIFCDGALSCVYGDSNVGKTFFVTDLALHVALGRDWRGRSVEQGAVVYCALEGAHGIRNRILAARKQHELHGLNRDTLPFAIITDSINLLDAAADTARLIDVMKGEVENLAGVRVRLLVIDTLSRALAGGNENSSEDMGALVKNADAIRKATGAHVLFVHHSGKDQARGARGHSLLRAATDTEIEISRSESSATASVKITKQRDLEIAKPFGFRLKPVELGTSRRGKPITSCVVVDDDTPTTPGPRPTPTQQQFYREICNFMAQPGNTRVVAPMPDMPKVAVAEVKAVRAWLTDKHLLTPEYGNTDRGRWRQIVAIGLRSKGLIGLHGDLIWLVRSQ
jgi:AAA domain